jgi:hypothetical protein
LNEPCAAEKAVVDLLRICLERIDWQGDLSEWQNRFLQALDRLQSALISETESPPMRVTAYQMDCIAGLCRAARTGIKDKIIQCASRFSDALLPYDHYLERGGH